MASADEIRSAAARLRAGGVVAFPTETVYGLGADATSEAAVARVFALKGRPASNPLIVHVADEAMARRVAGAWPRAAEALAGALWPGPLTLVVPKGRDVPAAVTAGGPTVALRVPDHPVALALLREFGGPLVGPSANRSGMVSPTTAAHVREGFPDERDVVVLEGGACRGGIESTVVDVTAAPARVLRRGLVTAAQLERVLGEAVAGATGAGAAAGRGGPLRSPGLLERHYAPRSPALLVDAPGWETLVRGGVAPGRRMAVLTLSGWAVPPPHAAIRMPPGAREYASRLYAALREADAMDPVLIAIERPGVEGPDGELWTAILDRLTRATAQV